MKFKALSCFVSCSVTALAFLGMTSNMPDETSIIKPSNEVLVRGKTVYNISCAPCHGLNGSGHGPISGNSITRPRDLTKAVYKNRSTASGQLPTDRDLDYSIALGVHASRMPGFSQLTSEDRNATVQYIKTFSQRFADSTEYPLEVIQNTTPIVASRASITKGHVFYLKMQCDNCHGTFGEGNGVSAYIQHDDFGDPVHTTDLTQASDYKFARNVKDVYRIFSTGMNGVAMPSYAGSIGDSDRWHLANYVWGLAHPSE